MPREVEQEGAGELDAVAHEGPVPADHPVAPLHARARVPLGQKDVPHAIHHGDPADHCYFVGVVGFSARQKTRTGRIESITREG